jgi:hypothetical protein
MPFGIVTFVGAYAQDVAHDREGHEEQAFEDECVIDICSSRQTGHWYAISIDCHVVLGAHLGSIR